MLQSVTKACNMLQKLQMNVSCILNFLVHQLTLFTHCLQQFSNILNNGWFTPYSTSVYKCRLYTLNQLLERNKGFYGESWLSLDSLFIWCIKKQIRDNEWYFEKKLGSESESESENFQVYCLLTENENATYPTK